MGLTKFKEVSQKHTHSNGIEHAATLFEEALVHCYHKGTDTSRFRQAVKLNPGLIRNISKEDKALEELVLKLIVLSEAEKNTGQDYSNIISDEEIIRALSNYTNARPEMEIREYEKEYLERIGREYSRTYYPKS